MAEDSGGPQVGGYRKILWQIILRHGLLYFLPLLLLAVFFHLQYTNLVAASSRAHLQVIAEHQAATLDLFLRERVINLANLLEDPEFDPRNCDKPRLARALARLRQASNTFVDLGLVNSQGQMTSYAGPVKYTRPIRYQEEAWFRQLLDQESSWTVTDIYLGFRNQPHFTIAIKRTTPAGLTILRAALSPDKIHEYLNSLEGAGEVLASVVNARGVFQVVTPRKGQPLQQSPFSPPADPATGYLEPKDGGFAYAWLRQTRWVLLVGYAAGAGERGAFAGRPRHLLLFTVPFFAVMGVIIIIRARQLASYEVQVIQHEEELSGQLVQAAKLASVGELAAGIAHEINNPLAIIAEEAGFLKDSLDPELPDDDEELDMAEHLDAIHDAVFRCRDITRKLLTFVRRAEVKLAEHHVHQVLEDVLDGMLGNELAISNTHVVREYDQAVPPILTDRNQLVQVLVNLVKNSIDAMGDGGTLTVKTALRAQRIAIIIRDTGCGMTPAQLEKVPTPFFTTKEPGKGTGLGLSVSFSIIKSFGGEMYVESSPGRGSTFTVELPVGGQS